ncbi:MAG: alanine--tRNA ligase [Chloroflexi bacterium]|nr:alanine--tRNA ligase [Chloroflexota bacterium]
MMTSDELRNAYLNFFAGKGHDIIPSASLIPHGDPTLLFTSAGMVQFKDYYLGRAVPPNPRLASCQKCFRMTDIESVGDASHLTFFEMLGNFSIGDYFKKESIAWAWEFVTERLKLPPERLWATIYLDDDESFQYWKDIGVPEGRILRFGEEDNFWGPAGNTGPCGPCSELHYDFGEEVGCGKPDCKPNCQCGRFSEIWNLVFTQYDQDESGKRTPLPKPNIDTGMGLERTVAAVTGKTSVYETELFAPLLESVSKLSGKKYGADKKTDEAMRVVAEHGRGVTFLIADGVIPSNEGRGYVLRRLLRRAALFGRRLGLDKPFLTDIAREAVGLMGHVYPEIEQRQDFILKLIGVEEARFEETLSTGLELLDGILAGLTGKKKNEITGEQAFKLYDTYGFPVEITREIARERGMTVDEAGFEKKMEKQREKARAAQKRDVVIQPAPAALTLSAAAPKVIISRQYETTPFIGYHDLKHRSVIIDILVDGSTADSVKKGQSASIILETTPFYGEMGGQVGDAGQIRGASGQFTVTDTIRIPPDIIAHQGKVADGALAVGEEVEAEVDQARRLDIARNHTATHLLQNALRSVLGEHVQQRGSLVAPDQFRFDFSHLNAMLKEEVESVQRLVNEKIRQDLPVYDEELPYKQAIAEGVIALFDEKYGDTVRVLRIGQPPVSSELCGGTHVRSTGEIGFFHIIAESSIGAGLRRIEAVTGRGAENFVQKRLADLQGAAESLGIELDKERKKVLALEKELARMRVDSLLGQVEEINGVKVLVARVPSSRMEILREMADFIRDKLKSVVLVLGTLTEGKPVFLAAVTPDLVARGYDAGKIIKEVAKVTGGGGGGKPNLAQAGGRNKEKLDEALRLVKTLI